MRPSPPFPSPHRPRVGRVAHAVRAAGAAVAALFLLATPPASACRYSVRDTGFVDLDLPPWQLRISGVSGPRREAWERAAASRLADANLRLEPAPASTPPGTPAALTLVAADGRELPLDPGVPLPDTAEAAGPRLDALVTSAFRDQLHDELLRSFAVLLLVEGTDPGRTTPARKAAEDAIRAFVPLLGSLPKPVEVPPRLVTLPAAGIAADRILVWSLGFHPEPVGEPRLAVLYGRGRPIGPVLEGPMITRTALEERLTLIGQDCECDLDRSWLQAPVFVGRWDVTRQSAAARVLGFDPENPMVRTEVTRIVLRGPLPGTSRRAATSGFDTLALGYREESVEASPADAPDPEVSTNTAASAAGAGRAASPTPPPPSPADDGASTGPRRILGAWFALSGTAFAVVALGVGLLVRALRSR